MSKKAKAELFISKDNTQLYFLIGKNIVRYTSIDRIILGDSKVVTSKLSADDLKNKNEFKHIGKMESEYLSFDD